MKTLAIVVLGLVLVEAQNAQNEEASQCSRVRQCSKKDPNLDQCFVRNGNLAIAELNRGVEDLNLPPIQGYNFGDLFIGLSNDLSFLLEDIKGYQSGLELSGAHLHFDEKCDWKRVDLNFSVTNAGWQSKYRAFGIINDHGNHKVSESGDAEIYFGNANLELSLDFRRRVVNGTNYLRAKARGPGGGNHEKFDFQARNQKGDGLPLGPDRFQELRHPVLKRATEVSLQYVVFVFNQILQEIPEKEIFLP